MKSTTVSALLLLSFLLLSTSTQAEVYKWVDDKGVTQYTQFPPPKAEDNPTETIKPVTTPADAGDKRKAVQDKWQQEIDSKNEKELDEQEKAAEEAHKAKLKKHCNSARKNLKALSDPTNRTFAFADGKVTSYDEKTRSAEIKKAQDYIKKYCNDQK